MRHFSNASSRVTAVLLSCVLAIGSLGVVPSYAQDLEISEDTVAGEENASAFSEPDTSSDLNADVSVGEEKEITDESEANAEGQEGQEKVNKEIDENLEDEAPTQENQENTKDAEEQGVVEENIAAPAFMMSLMATEGETFEDGGLLYKILSDHTVQVGNGQDPIAVSEDSLNVVIPSTVEYSGATYTVTEIGKRAFHNKPITSIVIPDSITVIGESAFGSTQLTEVTIPDTVVSMGNSVFSNASLLSSVTLSSQLSAIPENAFWSTAITEIKIPEGVTSIEKDAFNSCTSLVKVEIPASVTSIGENAFWGDTAFNTLLLAEGSQLKSIGTAAFLEVGIKKITFPDSVESIGRDAFKWAASLEEATFSTNSQLVSLGETAFSGAAIKEVYLPSGLTQIDSRPFDNCSKLTKIQVDENNTRYSSLDGVWFDKEKTKLIHFPAAHKGTRYSYTVPQTVKSIALYAFTGNTKLNSITMQDGLEEIGEFAFKGCTNLAEVTIPDSVNSIGRLAFQDCTSLETVVLPKSLKMLAGYTFTNCEALTEITIGENVETIEKFAAYNSKAVTTVVILSKKVKTIEKDAFSGVASNASFTVETPVIQQLLIASGISEDKITVQNPNLPTAESFMADGIYYKVLTQPDGTNDGIVQVGNGSSSVISYSTTTVEIPATVSYEGYSYQVTALGKSSFEADSEYGSSLKKVTLPKTLTVIGEKAFYGCSSLTEVILPSDTVLNSIGAQAFEDASLGLFSFPASLRTIGNKAFANNAKLSAVQFNEGLESIGDEVFSRAGLLKTVSIPETLTVIGKNAFANCSKLEEINVAANNPNYLSVEGVWFNKAATELLLYPSAKKAMEYTVPSTVQSIPEYAFANNTKLVDLTIPNGVQSIGAFAFQKASALESISIGNSVKSIGKLAFYSCKELTTVSLPAKLETMVSSLFYDCEALASITIPSGVKTIESGVISNCSALNEIIINATSVESIANGAFSGIPAEAGFTVRNDAVFQLLVSSGIAEARIQKDANVPVEIGMTFEQNGLLYEIVSVAQNQENGTVQVGNGSEPLQLSITEIQIPQTVEFGGKDYNVTRIADKAFQNLPITSITLPDGLTYIGENALRSTQISALHMPDSVVSIGKGAISSNVNLETVTLSKNLKVISEDAFVFSKALSAIVIPEGVETVGKSAFSYCETLTRVTIPASVKTIDEAAFFGSDEIVEVTIPDESQLERIGKQAFNFISGLKSIKLPATVQEIGERAFSNCTQLAEIGLPNGGNLKVLGENAFSYTQIKKFVIPATLTSVGALPLSNCEKLEEIQVSELNPSYASQAGVWYDKAMSELIQYPAQKKGTTFTTPQTLKAVAPYAFQKNAKLRELTIGNGVESIGGFAFQDAKSIEKITVADTVSVIGKLAFYTCPSLEELTLPANLKEIPSNMIYGCEVLETITIPKNVTKIQRDAIANCNDLKTVTIVSAKLTEIAEGAFQSLPSDAVFTVASENMKQLMVTSGIAADRITVESGPTDPEDTTSFEKDGVLYTVLTKADGGQNGTVQVGNGRDAILASGKVTLPAEVEEAGLRYTVTTIADGAFIRNHALTEITLPNTIVAIKDSAFYDCDGLLTVEVPASVKEIGVNAFASCEKLITVTFAPNSQLEKINQGAFSDNSAFTHITLPKSVTDLTSHVFIMNYDLETVAFETGSQLTEIPDGTFFRNEALREVTLPEGITAIGDQAFYNCKSLVSMDLQNVVEIGEEAFAYCETLQELQLSDDMTELSSGAFYGCTGLLSVQLGGGLEKLGEVFNPSTEEPMHGAFEGCTSLQSIVLPAKLQTIGMSSFKGSTVLKDVRILAQEILGIGANAFYDLNEEVIFTVQNEAVKSVLIKKAFLQEDRFQIPEPIVDKAGLYAQIKKAEGYKESSYKKESFARLQTAIAEAKAVAESALATQEEVNASMVALDQAIAQLSRKSSSDSDSSDSGGSSSNPKDTKTSESNAGTTITKAETSVLVKINDAALEESIRESAQEMLFDFAEEKNITSATFDTVTIEAIAKADKDIQVRLPAGTLTISAKAAESMLTQSDGKTVEISVETVDETNLTSEQQEASAGYVVYDLSIVSDGNRISQFDGGELTARFSYTLKEGERPEGIHVFYLNDNGVMEAMSSTYDEENEEVQVVLTHLSYYAVGYQAPVQNEEKNGEEKTLPGEFSDVSSHWAENSIRFVTEKGLFAGVSETTFAPDASMSRGMLVTVLGRLSQADVQVYQTSSFQDVAADSYYLPYIEWAKEHGIVAGVDGEHFQPDQAITREEIAVIFANYAKYAGHSFLDGQKDDFDDSAQISPWARDAVEKMQQSDLMVGGENHQFRPKASATRAEVATVLQQYIAQMDSAQ